jgi:uncharacterized membrane protein YidH (DUF202 family)
MTAPDPRAGPLQGLVDRGLLTTEALQGAFEAAAARGRNPEWILVHELGVPRSELLALLAAHYGCPAVEFDERLCVPPELLERADPAELARQGRFPLLQTEDTTVIAASDPAAPDLRGETAPAAGARRREPWVAFPEDIAWYLQDFLHAPPGALVGTERTGLAYWRNTMAHWRTRLACYRTELSRGRTALALLRWGLGLIALANVLLRGTQPWSSPRLPWLFIGTGLCIVAASVPGYWRIRRGGVRPPGHHTLVEVTAATLHFLDRYTPRASGAPDAKAPARRTMLARLGDLLQEHRRELDPPPVQKERAPLARERNVLAGQRTVAACYRTIYARARTGLAFIRTGVSFASLGIGLIRYYGFSPLTVFDLLLVLAGLLLLADGLWWYLPVRKEQAEFPASLQPLGGREGGPQ